MCVCACVESLHILKTPQHLISANCAMAEAQIHGKHTILLAHTALSRVEGRGLGEEGTSRREGEKGKGEKRRKGDRKWG